MALLAAVVVAGVGGARADNPAEALELPAINVVGTTPLPGLGTPLKDVPANVQTFGRRDLDRQRPDELTDFLQRNASSVSVGSGQGNPFQQDFYFRGFAASPLLGTPQGMSVFQDGVRINEAFADVVNWDLVPMSAISSIQLIPGSNPLFGPNTLGGALAINTKSGAQYPGLAVEAEAGSFRRREATVEYGGSAGPVDWFVTGHAVDDGGWAEHNPSRVRQLFGKLGYQDDITDVDVALTLADNALDGTQTLPRSWLDTPGAAYTYPDRNENRLTFVTAKGSRFLTPELLVGANAFYRDYRSTNVSSNVNDGFGEVDPDTGIAASNQAFNDRSTIDQTSWGAGIQLTYTGPLAGHRNQLAVGLSTDAGRTGFRQDEQAADFTPDRGTVATGPFAPLTDVGMRNRFLGVYATDTFALADAWTLTLSGRWNQARIEIADRSGSDPGLDGTHTFSRFSPAVGVNWNPVPELTAYGAYNEGMRAPTAIELTCADAAAPCKLPNLFLADPPLDKVVAKTWEAGARGRVGAATNWSAAMFRTDLSNDIQFVASGGGAINAGFFQNVGNTRRQGLELGAQTSLGPLALALRYSHLDATFRTAFVATSPGNSAAAADGTIEVRPGDRIPGIPADTAKLRADYAFGERAGVGLDVVYASGQYARGDENNQDANGRLPSFTVVNLDARFRITPGFTLFARVANLFDRRYENFAVLGANFFTGPGRTFGPAVGIDAQNEQFRAVGAPRGAWIGLRYAFDRPRGRD